VPGTRVVSQLLARLSWARIASRREACPSSISDGGSGDVLTWTRCSESTVRARRNLMPGELRRRNASGHGCCASRCILECVALGRAHANNGARLRHSRVLQRNRITLHDARRRRSPPSRTGERLPARGARRSRPPHGIVLGPGLGGATLAYCRAALPAARTRRGRVARPGPRRAATGAMALLAFAMVNLGSSSPGASSRRRASTRS